MRPLSDLPLFADRPQKYPYAPGFKGARGGASEQAARKIASSAKNLRGRVLAEYQAAVNGLTADEAATRLGLSILSVRPRVAELHRLGELAPSSERRANESGTLATVWKLAAAQGETDAA